MTFKLYTVKPVHNDHQWNPKCVTVVDMWSLFKVSFCYKDLNWDFKIMVAVVRWSIFEGDR
jgi:hypothetical protein